MIGENKEKEKSKFIQIYFFILSILTKVQIVL
jgi:hypothetical protein